MLHSPAWGVETDRHYIPPLLQAEAGEETVIEGFEAGAGGVPVLPQALAPGVQGAPWLAVLAALVLAVVAVAVYLKLMPRAPPGVVVAGFTGTLSSAAPAAPKRGGLYRYLGDKAKVRRALDSALRSCGLKPSTTPRMAGSMLGVEGWVYAERVLYGDAWRQEDVDGAVGFADRLARACGGGG